MKKIRLTESELINVIKKVVSEALVPSQYRKYVKNFDSNRYSEMFKTLGDKYSHDKNYYRIYIPLSPLEKKVDISDIERRVRSFLKVYDYELVDYIKGTAKHKNSKNIISLGKVLNKLKNEHLLKLFLSDEIRKSIISNTDELMVVISRHPYDIAGSDTDRNWTNCYTMGADKSSRIDKVTDELSSLKTKYESIKDTDLEAAKKLIPKIEELKKELKDRKTPGSNVKYILKEIKEGALISYLINKNDLNINSPISVLNIKPYANKENEDDIILVSDATMYGLGRPEFKNTVDKILDQMNEGKSSGLYCLNENLYSDSNREVMKVGEKEKIMFQTYEKIKKQILSNLKEIIMSNYDKHYKEIYDEIFGLYQENGFENEFNERKFKSEFNIFLDDAIRFSKRFIEKDKESQADIYIKIKHLKDKDFNEKEVYDIIYKLISENYVNDVFNDVYNELYQVAEDKIEDLY